MNNTKANVSEAEIIVTTREKSGITEERFRVPERLQQADLPSQLCGWIECLAIHGYRTSSIHVYPHPVDADGKPVHVTIFCSSAGVCQPLKIEKKKGELLLVEL